MPRTFDTGNNTLQLSPNFSIHITFKNPSQDLQNALSTTQSRLKIDKFERLVVGRGKTDAKAIQGASQLHILELSLLANNPTSIAGELALPFEFRSESYELTVPSDGSPATLRANSSLGLFRGLTTFGQMWYSYNGEKYILTAPLEIRDEPAFVCSVLYSFFLFLISSSPTEVFHLILHGICSVPYRLLLLLLMRFLVSRSRIS